MNDIEKEILQLQRRTKALKDLLERLEKDEDNAEVEPEQ